MADLAPPSAWWLLVFYLSGMVPLLIFLSLLFLARGAQGIMLLAPLGGHAVLLLAALAWVRMSHLRAIPLLRLTRPTWSGLLLALGVGVGLLVAGTGVRALWVSVLPASLVARFHLGLGSRGWSPLLEFALVALVPAACEEIAYRGALQTALLQGRSPARAIALGAVVFAVGHFDPVRLPFVLLAGLGFGWLAWRTGSIWTSMLAHTVNNGAAVLFAILGGSGIIPTTELARPEALAWLGCGLAVLALAGMAARRWLPPTPDTATFLIRLPASAERPAQTRPSSGAVP